MINRALTVYAEKFLKITDNYFESNNINNKLELFGARRDANYALSVPSLSAALNNNYSIQYSLQPDAAYTSQKIRTIGDGITAVG